MSELKIAIANNIKRIRIYKKVSAEELAKGIGVSQATVSNWENGKKMPRAGAVEKMSEFFNVPKTAILDDPTEISGAEYSIIDIIALLNSGARILHKGKILSDEEKQKIKKMLELVFE